MHEQCSHILLVEDEPQFVYLIERYADRSGYQLVHTRQEQDILTLAQHVQPVAVVLDVGVPALDVGVAIGQLRSDGMTRHIPIILCSSSEAVLRAWEPEVDGCWLKPVLYDEFVHSLSVVDIRPSGANENAK